MRAVSKKRRAGRTLPLKTGGFLSDISHNKALVIMLIPVIIFFIIFHYIPLSGLYLAFVDFDAAKGIWGSPFVGLQNFRFFFESGEWIKITRNTLGLNLLFLASGLVAQVGIAIMLSEIKSKWFKKITQSVVILPHFISWAVVALFATAILSADGYINQILTFFHLKPIEFYTDPTVWPATLAILKIWQGAGFGSIIYLATITGFDREIYEAAQVDGASRWQMIIRITIPLLKDTMIMLTILNVGKIFYGDFGMIYAMIGNNAVLFPTTDVIDTYVYRSLMQLGDMGMAAAIGLCQSVLGFLFVVGSNKLANKFSPDSAMF